MERKLLTPEELAAIYKVKPRTVQSWLRNKKIPAFKIGNRWWISSEVVESMLNGGFIGE